MTLKFRNWARFQWAPLLYFSSQTNFQAAKCRFLSTWQWEWSPCIAPSSSPRPSPSVRISARIIPPIFPSQMNFPIRNPRGIHWSHVAPWGWGLCTRSINSWFWRVRQALIDSFVADWIVLLSDGLQGDFFYHFADQILGQLVAFLQLVLPPLDTLVHFLRSHSIQFGRLSSRTVSGCGGLHFALDFMFFCLWAEGLLWVFFVFSGTGVFALEGEQFGHGIVIVFFSIVMHLTSNYIITIIKHALKEPTQIVTTQNSN